MRVERTKTIDNPGMYSYKEGWVETDPALRYVGNTRYYRRLTLGSSTPSYPSFSLAAYGGFGPGSGTLDLLRSRAYSKLIEDLTGPTSSLGNSLGEWRSSYDMIARRAIQLRNVLRHFRRGEVVQAARLLSVPEDTVRKARVLARTKRGRWRNVDGGASARHWASSLWLETYFGWLPLLADIHDSLTVLSDPVRNPVDIKPKGVWSPEKHHYADGRYTSGGLYVGTLNWGTSRARGSYYAKVQVSNPNLFLASRMGLVNPASIAWELTPFSFVVDWFANVGQILDSFTDFVGIEVIESGYSLKTSSSVTSLEYWPPGEVNSTVKADTVTYLRQPGPIQRPPLVFRSPLGNWTRAATQISLLNGYIKPR